MPVLAGSAVVPVVLIKDDGAVIERGVETESVAVVFVLERLGTTSTVAS
jgi:D-aminopeptidase